MPQFKPEHENALHKMVKDVPGATLGQMFGFPAYKIDGKLGLSVASNGIILKVGATRAKQLAGQPGLSSYEPQPGRVWKDWVLVTGNFDQHKALFDEAVKYVRAEKKK